MDVRWGEFAAVTVASLGITVVVVVMFSLGIAAWARAGAPGPRARAGTRGPRDAAGRTAAATAVLCFASCLAAAAYGIALLVAG